MTEGKRPAEPATDDKEKTRGGFAWVAEELNRKFPPAPHQRPISRQLVHKWWTKRHDNGFPEAIAIKGSANGGRGHHVFQAQDITDWYVLYRRTRLRGNAPGTTGNPLAPQQEHGGGSLAA